MNEKTLNEMFEEEVKSQLSDIRTMAAGSEEKTEAVRAVSLLQESYNATIKLQEEKKDRVRDRIMKGFEIGVPAVSMGIMYAIGMNFEKTGTLCSTFVRNLVSKIKFTK